MSLDKEAIIAFAKEYAALTQKHGIRIAEGCEMKWTTETGETRYLAVHALPAWGGGSQCDSADLIAALQANAAACGEVMAAMGWVTDRALAVTGERADQAERSLATVDSSSGWIRPAEEEEEEEVEGKKENNGKEARSK